MTWFGRFGIFDEGNLNSRVVKKRRTMSDVLQSVILQYILFHTLVSPRFFL